ncbi:hypothetical protein KC328_g89 [Hortaea werneckii]|nr:hypothetical protein KC328_g89 [Hortaea werneckii]
MDTGHYNCRDYHVTPHFAPTTIASDLPRHSEQQQQQQKQKQKQKHHFHYQLPRHESFDELEQRARSPASFKPKFPLLKLPLELRQEILSYLLPRTRVVGDTNPLASHAANFSAVQKRIAKGMVPPKPAAPKPPPPSSSSSSSPSSTSFGAMTASNGTTARRMRGANLRHQHVPALPDLRRHHVPFLELLPHKYLKLVRKVVVHIDHVDSYTGMIKFNVGGKGLTHGLRRQVQRLVNALKPRLPPSDDGEVAGDDPEPGQREDENERPRYLTNLIIRVSNGNTVLDSIKSDIVRQREGGIRENEDLEVMLEPFRQLYGVHNCSISGAVNLDFARELDTSVRSTDSPTVGECEHAGPVDPEDGGLQMPVKGTQKRHGTVTASQCFVKSREFSYPNRETTLLTSVARRITDARIAIWRQMKRQCTAVKIEAVLGVHGNINVLPFRGIVPAPATPPNASSVQRHANLQHAVIVHVPTAAKNNAAGLFLLARLLPAFCRRKWSALSSQNQSLTVRADVMPILLIFIVELVVRDYSFWIRDGSGPPVVAEVVHFEAVVTVLHRHSRRRPAGMRRGKLGLCASPAKTTSLKLIASIPAQLSSSPRCSSVDTGSAEESCSIRSQE